jgi:hypothetical protein
VTEAVPEPRDGQVLVRNRFLSAKPAMPAKHKLLGMLSTLHDSHADLPSMFYFSGSNYGHEVNTRGKSQVLSREPPRPAQTSVTSITWNPKYDRMFGKIAPGEWRRPELRRSW